MYLFSFSIMASPNNDDSSASELSVTFSDEDYDVEVEEEIEGARSETAVRPGGDSDDFDSDEGPYEGEPLADEEYIANYNRVVREQAQEEERLTRRFRGIESIDTW